jgi:hypothetical protein
MITQGGMQCYTDEVYLTEQGYHDHPGNHDIFVLLDKPHRYNITSLPV